MDKGSTSIANLAINSSGGNVGIGTTAPTSGKLQIAYTDTSVTGSHALYIAHTYTPQNTDAQYHYGAYNRIYVTNTDNIVAAGAVAGQRNEVYYSSGGGSIAGLYGTNNTVNITSAFAVGITNTAGIATQFFSSGGAHTIASMYGYWMLGLSTMSAGTVTSLYGFNCAALAVQAGLTITNAYGLYLGSITAGTSVNYAIQTNAGTILLNAGGDANSDFRYYGDTDTNLIFADASADMVGIGVQPTLGKLHVYRASTETTTIGVQSSYFKVVGNPATASTTTFYAFRAESSSGSATAAGSSLTGATLLGGRASVDHGYAGTVGNATGLYGFITNTSTGTITTATSILSEISGTAAGTIVTARGLYVNTPVLSGGSAITNLYGIYVANQNVGGTINYSIYTNTGVIHAGDKIEFTQTDGNEYIDSGSDEWVNIGATTGVEINAPILNVASLYSAGGFGCNGQAPQTEYTVNAAATDLDTVVALCNQLRAALIANGICVAA